MYIIYINCILYRKNIIIYILSNFFFKYMIVFVLFHGMFWHRGAIFRRFILFDVFSPDVTPIKGIRELYVNTLHWGNFRRKNIEQNETSEDGTLMLKHVMK